MKLQQLRYVLAIVDNGLNISAAASRLYTSQPGISRQLRLLEEELGVELFVRHGRSLRAVTPAGLQIIERARVIMQEVERLTALKRMARACAAPPRRDGACGTQNG
jgi:LysR family cys regulon transcriptional activator